MKICTRCGTKLTDDKSFCTNCGCIELKQVVKKANKPNSSTQKPNVNNQNENSSNNKSDAEKKKDTDKVNTKQVKGTKNKKVEEQQVINANSEQVKTVKDWIKTLVILAVPILNIVVLVMKIRKKNDTEAMMNFYKAYAIYLVAALIVSCILSAIINTI